MLTSDADIDETRISDGAEMAEDVEQPSTMGSLLMKAKPFFTQPSPPDRLLQAVEGPEDSTAVSGKSLREALGKKSRSKAIGRKGEPAAATSASSGPSESDTPLLYFHLTVQNKVDGKPVVRPGDQPSDPKERGPTEPPQPPHRWELAYRLTEHEGTDSARRLYNMCKERRRKLLSDEDAQFNYFLRKMRHLSVQGKEYRREVDRVARESRREAVVCGQ